MTTGRINQVTTGKQSAHATYRLDPLADKNCLPIPHTANRLRFQILHTPTGDTAVAQGHLSATRYCQFRLQIDRPSCLKFCTPQCNNANHHTLSEQPEQACDRLHRLLASYPATQPRRLNHCVIHKAPVEQQLGYRLSVSTWLSPH